MPGRPTAETIGAACSPSVPAEFLTVGTGNRQSSQATAKVVALSGEAGLTLVCVDGSWAVPFCQILRDRNAYTPCLPVDRVSGTGTFRKPSVHPARHPHAFGVTRA